MKSDFIDPYETLKMVYQDWCMAHPDKRADPYTLEDNAHALHLNRRDWLLQEWAQRTVSRVPAERLRRLVDRVLDLLLETDELAAREYDATDFSDEKGLHMVVASGLAVLRWHNQCRAGRQCDAFPMTLTEIRVWLHKNDFPVQSGQLSLFLDR